MRHLPVMLNVDQRSCLIVGGGKVAVRRAGSLLEAGACVTVVATQLDPAFGDMDLKTHLRTFDESDLQGVYLVIAATDDLQINRHVWELATKAGILVNRVDEPQLGDVVIPAHAHHGPVTLAVYTGGISASASAILRRKFSDTLGPHWPILLEVVAPFRIAIQQKVADVQLRHTLLEKLTDTEAMRILQCEGTEALRVYCSLMIDQAVADPEHQAEGKS